MRSRHATANLDQKFATEPTRPTAASELFHAPFLNLYADGRLCSGTARVPDPTDPDVQTKCEAMLFDSWSTHPNFDESKQTLHPGGILALMDARGE